MLLKYTKGEFVIENWDSLPNQSRLEKIKLQLLSSYERFSTQKLRFSISFNDDCYIQNDLDNCGVFLIGNIFAFIYKKKPCNVNPKKARIAIARMILSSIQPI